MTACVGDDCDRSAVARRMCNKHYIRWYRALGRSGRHLRLPPMERFMMQVDKSGPNGCWIWLGIVDHNGYGKFGVGARAKRNAHRWLWEELNGPASTKMHLDHLCRHRICVNPDHMELVTHAENLRRGTHTNHMAMRTHCPQGHPYDEENTGRTGNVRWCRTCKREKNRARRARRRLAGDGLQSV